MASKLIQSVSLPTQQANSFDIGAFERAVASHGVKLVHWRAMRCPVGLVDLFDGRRPNHDHIGCSNGFVYTLAGDITALFTGNSESAHLGDTGFLDGSTVQVTVQRFYDGDNEEPVHVANFDRFYLSEEAVTVPHWQLFSAHITGKEKLQFPVVSVQDLMDSNGKRYYEGDDFDLSGGYIVWRPGQGPTFDVESNRGQICAIRFTYRPYWYVKQLLHQVRVVQVDDVVEGKRTIKHMPQAMVLQREYVFENQSKDPEATEGDPARQMPAPRDGAFGPR